MLLSFCFLHLLKPYFINVISWLLIQFFWLSVLQIQWITKFYTSNVFQSDVSHLWQRILFVILWRIFLLIQLLLELLKVFYRKWQQWDEFLINYLAINFSTSADDVLIFLKNIFRIIYQKNKLHTRQFYVKSEFSFKCKFKWHFNFSSGICYNL